MIIITLGNYFGLYISQIDAQRIMLGLLVEGHILYPIGRVQLLYGYQPHKQCGGQEFIQALPLVKPQSGFPPLCSGCTYSAASRAYVTGTWQNSKYIVYHTHTGTPYHLHTPQPLELYTSESVHMHAEYHI